MKKPVSYQLITWISALGIFGQSALLFAAQLPDSDAQNGAPAYSAEYFIEANERLANEIQQQSVSALEESDIPDAPTGFVLREYFYTNGSIKKREYRNAQNKLVQVWNYSQTAVLINIRYVDPATARTLKYEYYDAQQQLTSASEYDITRSANRITKTTTYYASDAVNSEATFNPANGYQTGYKVKYESGITSQLDTFDTNGKKTTSTFYYPSGLKQTFSQYNVSTNKIILSEYFDTNEKLTQRREFTSGGVPTKTTFYNPDGLKTSANFYTSGKLSSTEWYFDNGNINRKDTINTGSGAVTKTEYFSRSAVIKQKLEYKVTTAIALRKTEYDTDGQVMYLTEYNASNQITKYVDYVHVDAAESAAIYSGLIRQQTAAGLIASHPEDQSFIYHEGIVAEWAKINAKDQAYTYDQAVFGMTMIKNLDLVSAKKVFDFFYNNYQTMVRDEGAFNGFWTVYDKDGGWKKYEYRKGMGENAWMAIFALQYANATTDTADQAKALELAKNVVNWIKTLPHSNGAVAMGPLTGGNPDFGKIYSTENMLDYYGLLRDLIAQLPAGTEKTNLTAEFTNLKNWLKNSAFDRTKNLFKQGGDTNNGSFVFSTVQALDVNSWAIQAIGPAALIQDFGINLETFVAKIESTFGVQPNGSYGGSMTTASGFDFSDAANAAALIALGKPRPALVWGEGTAGMITSYWKIAQYYRSINNTTNAAKHETKALYFTNKLKASALRVVAADGSVTHRYASTDDIIIYSNNLGLKTSVGASGISSAWIFLSLMKFNPFFV